MYLQEKWMQLGMIILCELSHTQKDKYHAFSHLWFLDFYSHACYTYKAKMV